MIRIFRTEKREVFRFKIAVVSTTFVPPKTPWFPRTILPCISDNSSGSAAMAESLKHMFAG